MTDKKDFLSQFSTNNKPDSFKEEERIKVEKPNKNINPKVIIIAVISLIVIVAIIFLLFFMPKIKVEDFTGAKKEDAIAWIRQQGIESSGILFKEEYSFDTESGIILSQEPATGKVTNKAKMTFIVSKGPDPDESIKVPDLSSMDRESITSWINTNKLLSTKINTTYSEEVEKDGFIKADYSGCDEDTFTRGCTLKISISKGAKPQDEITMANFVKKTFAEFEAWATPKKIKLNKTEAYSDTVDAGLIISQSVKENEKVVAGDTVNVVVSKGKGIRIPNFSTMEKSDIEDWIEENKVYVKEKQMYSDSDNYVISQSLQTGAYIGSDRKLEITTNLGSYFYLDEVGITGFTSYDKVKDYSYELQEKGIYIDTHKNYVDSDLPKHTIIGINKIFSGNNTYSTAQRLPLVVEITFDISKGETSSPSDECYLPYYDYIGDKLAGLINWRDNNPEYNIQIEVRDKLGPSPDVVVPVSSEYSNREVISIKYYDGSTEQDISAVGGIIPYNSKLIVDLGGPVSDN